MNKTLFQLFSLMLVLVLYQGCGYSEKTQNSSSIFRGNISRTGDFSFTKQPPSNLSLKWKFKSEYAMNCTPIIYKGTIFYGDADGHVYALDEKSGALKWKMNFSTAIDYALMTHDNYLYFSERNGEVYCCDITEGAIIWKKFFEKQICTDLIVYDEKLIVCDYAGNIQALNYKSGDVLWSYKAKAGIGATNAIHNNILYVGDSDKNLNSINLDNGKLYWELKLSRTLGSIVGVSFYDDKLYVVSSLDGVYCINPNNQNIIWKFKCEPVSDNLCVNENYVIFGAGENAYSPDKSVDYLIALDRKKGTGLWKYNTTDVIISAPIICKDKVYFGCHDHYAHILGIDKGEEIWSYKTEDNVFADIVINDGSLLISSWDSNLYYF